jgi:hypothetical protein
MCCLELTGEVEVLGLLGMELIERGEEHGDIVCEVLPRIRDDEIDFTQVKHAIFARPREFFQSLYDKHYSKYAESNSGTTLSSLESYGIKEPTQEEVDFYTKRYGIIHANVNANERKRAEEIFRRNVEQSREKEMIRKDQERRERSRKAAEKKREDAIRSKDSARSRKLRSASAKRKSKRIRKESDMESEKRSKKPKSKTKS